MNPTKIEKKFQSKKWEQSLEFRNLSWKKIILNNEIKIYNEVFLLHLITLLFFKDLFI